VLAKKRNKAIQSKVIKPSNKLTSYLDETLEMEKYKSKPHKQKQKLKQKQKQQMARKIRSNDEKKVRMLDYLFKSMADLIYFFEFVNNHPVLIERFDDDILDILGLRESQLSETPAAFSRFIQALICGRFCDEVHQGYDYGKRNFTYRYHLLGIMQRHIMEKAMPVYSSPYYLAKEPYATEYTNKEDRQAIYDKFLVIKQLVEKLDKFWFTWNAQDYNPSAMFPKRTILPERI